MATSEAPLESEVVEGESAASLSLPMLVGSVPTLLRLRAEFIRLLRSGAAWVALGRVLGATATVLVSALSARLLSADDYGRFLLFSTLIAFGTVSALFGLSGAGLRFLAERLGAGDIRGARHALKLTLMVAVGAMLAVAAVSYALLVLCGVPIFHEPQLREFALLIVGYVVCFAVVLLIAELLRAFRELRFASLLAGPSGGSLANFLFMLLLAGSIPLGVKSLGGLLGLQFLAIALVVPFGIGCFYFTARSRLGAAALSAAKNATPLPSLTLSQLLRVCFPLLLTQLLMIVLMQCDIWIGGAVLTLQELALYGAARRMMILVAIPTQMLTLTVMSSIPELFVQRRLRELEQLLQSSAVLAVLPSFAALLLLLIFPSAMLGLVFGGFYRDAAAPLVILALGQVVCTWVGIAGSGYTLGLTGHHHIGLAVNAVTLVIYLAVGPLAAARFGMTGLAVASALVTALQSLALWALTKKFAGFWTHVSLASSTAGYRIATPSAFHRPSK